MMFAIIILLCCTPVSVADTSDHDLAPPFDMLERAFKVLEREAQACTQVEEMRGTLDRIVATLSELKDKVDTLETTVTDATSEIKDRVDTLETTVTTRTSEIRNKVNTAVQLGKTIKTRQQESLSEIKDTLETTVTDATSEIKDRVNTAVQLGTTIKTRQQAWLSEVRLISLFKLTGENNPYGGAYNPGLAVDGQYVFSYQHEVYMRTYSDTGYGYNNNIWIDLGGLFRVYSVRVWNRRDSYTSRFEGTQVYVGYGIQSSELIGTASGDRLFYDFTLPDATVKYGYRVTLLQRRYSYIHVLEVQVWGNGPYDSSDKFN